MAALLVAIAIMGVLMSAAMPVWRQQAQREKEEELIFRGEQYARAIGLFQRKFAGAFPPNTKVLLDQKFIRKLYKDPITNDEFQPVYQGAPAPGTAPGGASSRTPGMPATTGRPGEPETRIPPASSPGGLSSGGPTSGQVGPTGGLLGFTSKSKATSIRLYKGRNKYNEWVFVYTNLTQAPGMAPGAQRPGMPGGTSVPGMTPGRGTAPGRGTGPGRGGTSFPPSGVGLPGGRGLGMPTGRPPG